MDRPALVVGPERARKPLSASSSEFVLVDEPSKHVSPSDPAGMGGVHPGRLAALVGRAPSWRPRTGAGNRRYQAVSLSRGWAGAPRRALVPDGERGPGDPEIVRDAQAHASGRSDRSRCASSSLAADELDRGALEGGQAAIWQQCTAGRERGPMRRPMLVSPGPRDHGRVARSQLQMATLCPASAPRRTGKRPEVIRVVKHKKCWSDALSRSTPQVAGTPE